MRVKCERLVGPEHMLAAMRTTTGKSMYDANFPRLETWHKMLLSTHSSHRAVLYRVYIEDIPYFAHVYLIRHHLGIQPHVYSQRDDGGAELHSKRDSYPQGALISMCADINADALLQIARKRLCYKSHRVIQEVLRKIKISLIANGDKYDQVLGNLMMRPCEWYPGYCSEPSSCGRFPEVKQLADVHQKVLKDHLG